MRVIAGTAKGRPLFAPPGRTTRPTTDRVKESLFAILASVLADAQVLDLFAGSGALAIEALSRGASHAVLVERDRAAADCIRRNLERTGLADRAELLTMPVLRALPYLAKRGDRFDLAFLDPPYGQGQIDPVLATMARLQLLVAGSLVAVEHANREEMPVLPENFAVIRQEDYGDTRLTFLRVT